MRDNMIGGFHLLHFLDRNIISLKIMMISVSKYFCQMFLKKQVETTD
jgi:hypothetical protein